MGDWTLIVSGTGIHHNNIPATRNEGLGEEDDADQRFLEFVDLLTKAGHQLRHAAFVHGSGADTVEIEWAAGGCQIVRHFDRASGACEDAQALIAARKVRREKNRTPAS